MPQTPEKQQKSTWCAICKSQESIPEGWNFPENYLDGKWHHWPNIDGRDRFNPFIRSIGPINDIQVFMMGKCDTFALALHEITGWKIAFGLVSDPDDNDDEDEEDDYDDEADAALRKNIDHAFCIRPDDSVVDVRGIHPNISAALVNFSYSAYALAYPQIDEDYRWKADNEDFDLAVSLINQHPEFFGIDSNTQICADNCCEDYRERRDAALQMTQREYKFLNKIAKNNLNIPDDNPKTIALANRLEALGWLGSFWVSRSNSLHVGITRHGRNALLLNEARADTSQTTSPSQTLTPALSAL